MSNIVANLQENRAVFRYFVALLRFSFEPATYISTMKALVMHCLLK
jgi:hypothetical protein